MGLLDYIKANTPRATTPRVKPGTVVREGLLSPNQFNAPAANRFKDSLFGLAGVVPGVGDVASGVEALDYWNRGEKGNAGLAALGMLPFVPALGGILKSTKPYTSIYHGTTQKAAKAIEHSGFDLTKSADGTVWFTSNPNIGEVAASGKGGIVKRMLDEQKLKLGGWDEMDKFSVDELVAQGYDGLKLDDGGEITYQIFNPDKLIK